MQRVPTTDRILPAIALRLTSVALFALMNVSIKLAEAGGADLAEILFWRQAGAAVLIAGVVAAGPGMAGVATARFGSHVLRTVLGLIAMALTFFTLTLLPLAEATTLGFSMPIFATALGALIAARADRLAALGGGGDGVLRGADRRAAG